MYLEFKNPILQKLLLFARKRLLKFFVLKLLADFVLSLIQNTKRLWFRRRYEKFALIKGSKASENSQKILLEAADIQTVKSPTYFGLIGEAPNPKLDFQYVSRACFAVEVPSVRVIANTDFLIQNKTLIHDDYFLPHWHVSTIDRFGLGKFAKNGKTAKIFISESAKKYEKAINLTNTTSGNFSHFLMEVIPKLLYLDKEKLFLDYPILFDEDIGKPLKGILDFFNQNNRTLIPLKRFEQVEVSSLVHVISPQYAPLDILNVRQPIVYEEILASARSATIFSKDAVDLLAETARASNPKPEKKLYLYRQDQIIDGLIYNASRHVTNQKEITSILKKLDFEIVHIENLDFQQQIELFASAKLIVGPIGAALANSVFTQPGTKIIALASYYQGCDFNYHSRMMSAFDRELLVVLGKLHKVDGVTNAQSPYEIDRKDLLEAIQFSEIE